MNVETLKLRSFTDDYAAPPYIILSHCWGDDEVTLQDVLTRTHDELRWTFGWKKIADFCLRVQQNESLTCGVKCKWVWVDTCCIDKTSSAELSEAINSMFRWYRKAICCFALLPDTWGHEENGNIIPPSDFEKSRWFTRGWTLQELLAPYYVYFFDVHWQLLGDKRGLAARIENATKIDPDALHDGTWEHCNIAQIMSWAADRKTTRREDLAYCLMGLFDVNMPLLYGEGDKAFVRLQEEIMKESNDQSILAWDASHRDQGKEDSTHIYPIGALATHPSFFTDGGNIETLAEQETSSTLTAWGLQISLPVINQQIFDPISGEPTEVTVALLPCRFMNDIHSRVGVPVQSEDRILGRATNFARKRKALVRVPNREGTVHKHSTIYLAKKDRVQSPPRQGCWRCLLQYATLSHNFTMMCAMPQDFWTESRTRSCTMVMPRESQCEVQAVVAFSNVKYSGKAVYIVLALTPANKGQISAGIASSNYGSREDVQLAMEKLISSSRNPGEGRSQLPSWLDLDDQGWELRVKVSETKNQIFNVGISQVRRSVKDEPKLLFQRT